ncbi:hypothetical protein ACWDAY_32745 [Streptomyces olivaceus]
MSVDTKHSESGGTEMVDSLLAAGCSEKLTTFYVREQVQHLPELAALVGELWLHTSQAPPTPLSPQAALEVAEVLALGATDSLGVPEAVIQAARATAAAVNRRLTSSELPLPILNHSYSPQTGPATDAGQAAPQRGSDAPRSPSQGVDRLLSDGALTVSLDCEQLIDLLFEVTGSPS